jgi:hypothetical protein
MGPQEPEMTGIADFTRGFRRGAGEFALSLNCLVNSALLAPAYVIGVGLSRAIVKARGLDLLRLAPTKGQGTYWARAPAGRKLLDDYYRQF